MGSEMCIRDSPQPTNQNTLTSYLTHSLHSLHSHSHAHAHAHNFHSHSHSYSYSSCFSLLTPPIIVVFTSSLLLLNEKKILLFLLVLLFSFQSFSHYGYLSLLPGPILSFGLTPAIYKSRSSPFRDHTHFLTNDKRQHTQTHTTQDLHPALAQQQTRQPRAANIILSNFLPVTANHYNPTHTSDFSTFLTHETRSRGISRSTHRPLAELRHYSTTATTTTRNPRVTRLPFVYLAGCIHDPGHHPLPGEPRHHVGTWGQH